ncbi:MAG: nickel-dependent lactate racemase [Synergistaceae bacterium]|jgi:hypothetical protein|nr:nickel-dependent lactate racemase [Synergistaceae bacterium]
MPVLLEEDMNFPLPRMHKVKQVFPRQKIEDVEDHVVREMRRAEVRGKIKPGAKVAVAVGSRGIKNLALIVRTVLREIRAAGGVPFVVAAMGSHGGGTPEGQRAVLRSYGITEEAMGAEVVTSVDVVHLGKTSRGIDVYFDSAAAAADLVVPVNRVKLHTDFVADIQSGLCKMLVIGLGNHKGCTALHEEDFDFFGVTLPEAAEMILGAVNVGFGVAIIENACDETALIEAIPSENLIEREKRLVRIAKKNMPSLMIPEIDILIVEEIGKNISGAGYDPNILGKSFILKQFVLDVPKIRRMVLLDVTEESHGNAIGMGIFDVITRKVFDKLDLAQIYANAIAVKCPEDARIPIIADSEDEAVRIARRVTRGVPWDRMKIVKIKNTIELETIEISDTLAESIPNDGKLVFLE